MIGKRMLGTIIGQNEKGLLVDGSERDGSVLRLQFVALNSDCPQSPVKAVNIQAKKMPDSPYFVDLGLIFKEYPANIASINEGLKGTGFKVLSGASLAPPGEPIREFLSPILGDTEAAGAQYLLTFTANDQKLQHILGILHERGIIGDAIKQACSKLTGVMDNDMAANARKLIEDPLRDERKVRKKITGQRASLPPSGRG